MELIELPVFCGVGGMTGMLKSIAKTYFIKRSGRRKGNQTDMDET